jgi:hypothetical protein
MKSPKVLDNKKYRVVDELKRKFVRVQSCRSYRPTLLFMRMQSLRTSSAR